MAKKGSRINIALVCSQCNSQNYITQKSKVNNTGALQLKKYCKVCKSHRMHREKKKLH